MTTPLTKNPNGARNPIPFLVLALVALGAHTFRYWPFISDQALISLRVSKRLREGLGLTWDSFDPAESYSSLLWVLANAGLGSTGIDLVVSSRIFGGLGMAAALLACLAAARRFRWPGVLPFLFSSFVLALSGSMAVWLIGGLEQGFVAAFLAWSMILVQRATGEDASRQRLLLGAGVFLSALVLTLPGAPVLVVALAAATWSACGFRETIRLVMLPLAAFAGQMLFRIAYHGDWLPASSGLPMPSGLAYVGTGLFYLLPVLLPWALAFSPRVREHLASRRLLAPLFVLVAWSGYLVFVGGDLLPARRHLVPIVVILALMLGELAAAVLQAGGGLRRAALPVFGIALFALGLGQYQDPQNRRAVTERWEWNGRAIGLFYKQAFGEQQPLLATTATGSVPFWSELPALDMLGFGDEGDGAYALSREPDLVIEGVAIDGTDELWSPTAKQMVADPEWMNHYVIVRFVAREPKEHAFHTFVRSTSEKIGIRRTDSSVMIPGYLYAAAWQSVAGLDPEGELAIALSESAPAGPLRVPLDAGRWRVEFETYGDFSKGVRLAVQPPGALQRTLPAGGILELPESGATMTAIATRARDPIHVRAVTFHKLTD